LTFSRFFDTFMHNFLHTGPFLGIVNGTAQVGREEGALIKTACGKKRSMEDQDAECNQDR